VYIKDRKTREMSIVGDFVPHERRTLPSLFLLFLSIYHLLVRLADTYWSYWALLCCFSTSSLLCHSFHLSFRPSSLVPFSSRSLLFFSFLLPSSLSPPLLLSSSLSPSFSTLPSRTHVTHQRVLTCFSTTVYCCRRLNDPFSMYILNLTGTETRSNETVTPS
jgi:hypothetical protein